MSKRDIITMIVALSVSVIAIIALIIFGNINLNQRRVCHYEWEDALGNYGTANSCSQTHQGNLICLTDSTRRQVINYTYVCE